MSVAASILDAVRAESLHPGAHIVRAGLHVGELFGVEIESLRSCLDALVPGSGLEPLARRDQPGIEILDLSCTSGDGLDRWYAWIERHL